MPRKGSTPSRGVSIDRFVVSWTKAKSVAQVAKWTGMKPQAASIKASLLRKKGVALKKFETVATAAAAAPKVWSVAALNDLIKQTEGTPKPGKKKLGRPKGSKNKPKEEDGAIQPTAPDEESLVAEETPEDEPEPDEILAADESEDSEDEDSTLAATDELDEKFPRL